MFHTVAYSASIAQLTDSDIPALADQIIPIVNGHFQPQEPLDLVFAVQLGLLVDRARLSTPKMRQVVLPQIRPFNALLLPPTDPNVADYRANPFKLVKGEEVASLVTTNAAGPGVVTTILGLQVNREPMPAGDVYTMRGTSTTAAVANTWTDITMTYADSLPAGTYAVVGMEHFSATGKAARIICDNQYWRPGCLSINALGARAHDMFRKGGLGQWGRFENTSMPRVQVLDNAVAAVHEVYLDLIRLR